MVSIISKETLLFFIALYLNPVMTDLTKLNFVNSFHTLTLCWLIAVMLNLIPQ